jgi:hypothetical protein
LLVDAFYNKNGKTIISKVKVSKHGKLCTILFYYDNNSLIEYGYQLPKSLSYEETISIIEHEIVKSCKVQDMLTETYGCR